MNQELKNLLKDQLWTHGLLGRIVDNVITEDAALHYAWLVDNCAFFLEFPQQFQLLLIEVLILLGTKRLSIQTNLLEAFKTGTVALILHEVMDIVRIFAPEQFINHIRELIELLTIDHKQISA